MRRITIADVKIQVIPTDNNQSPRRSYAVPGIISADSEDTDRFVRDVEEMIDEHGLWGWCQVEVKATFGQLTGSAYLGGCSYKDEDDFRNGGYLDQMVDEAIGDIQTQLDEIVSLLASRKDGSDGPT